MVASLRMKNDNYITNEQSKMHYSFFILHSSFFILHFIITVRHRTLVSTLRGDRISCAARWLSKETRVDVKSGVLKE